MEDCIVPLIVRGRIVEGELIPFGSRRGELRLLTPDVRPQMSDLVLRNSVGMRDLHSIPLEEIVRFLDELGHRLSPNDNPYIRKAVDVVARTGSHTRDMLWGMYETMRKGLYRASVEEIIEQTVGEELLEGWENRTLQDRRVRVRAFGARVLHLIAGNGPPVAIQGIVHGSILRCDNIIKLPSNDPLTAVAVVQTMIDMAPDHPITRHHSVAYWKGGDEAIEKQLYKPTNLDKIVAWGGFASMGHVRKYLVPGLDLIALDPKLSISIVGKEAFSSPKATEHAAKQVAKDVGLFNQTGCVSSRTVFVESGTDAQGIERINALAQRVFTCIQELPEHLSSAAPSFDPVLRQELDGIRHSDLYRVIGGKQSEGAIVVSQESEPVDFADRLACRVANLVPVDSVDDVMKWITLDTQTVGVYPEQLKSRIAEEFAWRGVQRLTSLGCAVYEGMGYPHDSIELVRRMARWIVIEDFDEEAIERGAGLCMG